MDEYTDKAYQGSGFTGERMGGATQTPPAPSSMEPPAAPAAPTEAPPSADIDSTLPRDRTIWDEPPPPDQGEMKGLMVQGALLGFFFGIFGVIGVAFFSASEKRADRVMGSIIGILVSFFVAGVIIVATA